MDRGFEELTGKRKVKLGDLQVAPLFVNLKKDNRCACRVAVKEH
jgi:hypothetical protein